MITKHLIILPAVTLHYQKPKGFRMPGVFKAVYTIEYDGITDFGDSADMEGDQDSVMAGLAPTMYFEKSANEAESAAFDEDAHVGDGLGDDADFMAEMGGS
jgi:hypothetical protein